MRRKILILILTSLIILIFNSCIENKSDFKGEGDIISEENNSMIEENENNKDDDFQEIVNSMTLDEKIGQLLIVGFEGTYVDEDITDLIKNKYLGGIIFFRNNVESLSGVISLTNELRGLNSENKVPLFISVDEEGGLVSRVPNEFIKIPSAEYIGAFDNKGKCYELGSIIAEELKVMGYNMDYAPVLDILSNHNNTVIGNRAFGNNAETVSRLAVNTMKGIQDKGVISVVKHFPGHGDTTVDSHYGLPLVEKNLDELKALEFIPFENAIKNGADAIMVSHILLENVDSDNPASMSKIIISDILRNDMNFKGVVVTDDMTMGAIVENYDIGEAAVKSINAGSDIVLVCHGYDNEIKVFNSIKEAVNNGTISEERLNESVYRILSLKKKYNLNDKKVEELTDISEINRRIEEIVK